MIEYTPTKIKKIGKVVTGKTPPTKDKNNYGEGYMFIGPTDLHEGFFVRSSEKTITDDGMNSVKSNQIDGLSILVGCIGWDMGNVALTDCKCVTNQQINSITQIKDKYNPLYVYYWLSNKKEYLFSQASVTRTPILNKTRFESIEIPMPDRVTQDKVVNVLSLLDRKIEINKKINQKLEVIQKALFEQWILRFEFPTEDGSLYKTSNKEFYYNEELKDYLPIGWKFDTVEKYIKITRGVTYENEDIIEEPREGYIPLLRANNSQNGIINYRNLVYVPEHLVSEEQMLCKNSILITMSSGSKEHMGKTAVIYDDMPYTYGAFCSKISFSEKYRGYFSVYFRSEQYKKTIEQKTLGTSINNITNDYINGLKVIIPSDDILTMFENKVRSMLDQQARLIEDNKKLSALRNYLLPVCLSGKIKY